MASTAHLSKFIQTLNTISHVKTVRIHSRIPIVLPERIDDELIAILSTLTCHKVLVIHCNHANELDNDIGFYLSKLKQIGFHLLNQSVLLKGINDDPRLLKDLSEKLFEIGVLPYYLHQLDKVKGAHHFDIDENTAKTIHHALKSILPGYLVPKLVKEMPHEQSKTWINA